MTSIALWTEPLPDGWHWDPRNPRRGTEEFYVRTAEEMAAAGNDVCVIYDGIAADLNNVEYRPRNHRFYGESVIACNSPLPDGVQGYENCVYWTNLYGETYDANGRHRWLNHANMLSCDAVVLISEFQRSIFRAPPSAPVHVIGHGCDPERLIPAAKAPICAFTSSPDRGLDFLRGIWPVVERETGYRLVATDGTQSNDEVDALYRSAKFWLHPGLGVELFCLSALKAQAAGCIPVVVPHMALAETVKGGVKVDIWHYQEALIDAIQNPPPVPEPPEGGWPTWRDVTARLLAVLGVL